MDLTYFLDRMPEPAILVLGGLLVGIMFGVFAQQSRFCLRAAALEFSRGRPADRLPIWLLAFSSALIVTQGLGHAGLIDIQGTRQIASPQSLSGALIGGLMFGTGMVMARGCASRLLVLSATGNLRALLSGLVFAVVAQASLYGLLRPARDWLSGLWTTVEFGGNDLASQLNVSAAGTYLFGGLWMIAGLGFAWRNRSSLGRLAAAVGAGLAVPAALLFTTAMTRQAFDPIQVEGVTFTGPSADTLMLFLSTPPDGFDFASGLVPGVFLGSFFAALLTGQLALQGFESGPSMARYLSGAALMGFGGMLAGGCAVGAGITGASLFATTAWVTLIGIWSSASLADYFIDKSPHFSQAPFQSP